MCQTIKFQIFIFKFQPVQSLKKKAQEKVDKQFLYEFEKKLQN